LALFRVQPASPKLSALTARASSALPHTPSETLPTLAPTTREPKLRSMGIGETWATHGNFVILKDQDWSALLLATGAACPACSTSLRLARNSLSGLCASFRGSFKITKPILLPVFVPTAYLLLSDRRRSCSSAARMLPMNERHPLLLISAYFAIIVWPGLADLLA